MRKWHIGSKQKNHKNQVDYFKLACEFMTDKVLANKKYFSKTYSLLFKVWLDHFID